LKLQTLNAIQKLAAESPNMTVTATGMSQRLHRPPSEIRRALILLTNEGLLVQRIVDECEECGRETEGSLEEAVGPAICLACNHETSHNKIVIFEFSPALLEVARERDNPKAQTVLAKLLRLLRRSHLIRPAQKIP
jgi:hypothetical protein